ncbi:MAG: hypothetical protein AAF654_11615 [Myxococcota bacterium]
MGYARIDVALLAAEVDVDWNVAKKELLGLYSELDERLSVRTRGLDLPCHRGCSACCHESVFVTPLEFLLVWEHAQNTLPPDRLDQIIERGLAAYRDHESAILALESEPVERHDAIAATIKFTCPLLGAAGECQVYPVRELYARLFGCSFNAAGGVYGCHLVGAHLAEKTVTLPRVMPWAQRLNQLPLTFKRQVYPFWIHWLYG